MHSVTASESSLFPGGIGNTWGDADAFTSLVSDVESKLFGQFADDTWFHRGHDKDGMLGAERPSIAEWRLQLVAP